MTVYVPVRVSVSKQQSECLQKKQKKNSHVKLVTLYINIQNKVLILDILYTNVYPLTYSITLNKLFVTSSINDKFSLVSSSNQN